MDRDIIAPVPDLTGWAGAWFGLHWRYWETWFDLVRAGTAAVAAPDLSPAAKTIAGSDRPAPAAKELASDSLATTWLRLLGSSPLYSSGTPAADTFAITHTAPIKTAAALADRWFHLSGDFHRASLAAWQSTWNAWTDPLGLARRPPGSGSASTSDWGAAGAWSGLATLLGMPLDNWRRVMSTYSMAPGDMEKAIRQPGSPYGPETVHRTMIGFLSMPAIGYTREWQEEVQRWGLLWLDHWQALQDYGAAIGPSVFEALERFGTALGEPGAGEEACNSLRGFYNLWIDCSEEAYGRLSFSPEFVEAQSRLSNSLFALKRQEQWMVEELQSALNMPTRRELDTSHKRMHQLNRRLWQVEQTLEERAPTGGATELETLQRELDSLRQRLDALAPPMRSGS